MFDVAVIGLGLIGSAAIRYLSHSGSRLHVIGIGPAEPFDWKTHQGAFASHYDHARLTRITDADRVWATLAQRAMESYQEIERASGIPFHYPVGHLRLGQYPDAGDDSLNNAESIGHLLNAPVEHLDYPQLAAQFPYLGIPQKAHGLYERGGAGYINPRALVTAQLAIAATQGATIVRDEVQSMARNHSGFTLRTRSGQTLHAARVLLCTHGYTNNLVHTALNRTLDLVNLAHTTVYADVSDEQCVDLTTMPTVIWPLHAHPVLESVYTTPPQVHRDGRRYLKIGGPLFEHPRLDTPAAMRQWFQSDGNPIEIDALQSVLRDLIPDLRVRGWHSKPCMNTYTAHGYPYIDQLDDGIYVCTGGCGSAAKSSDEIGRIGALLIQHGTWNYDLPANLFRVVEAALPETA